MCSFRVKPTSYLSTGIIPFEDIFPQIIKHIKNPDFCFEIFLYQL